MTTFKIHCNHEIGNILQKSCLLDNRVIFCSYNKEYILNDYILFNLKTTTKEENKILIDNINKIQKNLVSLNKKFKENI